MPALGRRAFIAGAASLAAAAGRAADAPAGPALHGQIGKMKAVPGRRDALIALLLEGADAMPGCLSYVVARDPADGDAIWITEVWDSRDSHRASLRLPQVREAIAQARPLIAAFDTSIETEPVGGFGLR